MTQIGQRADDAIVTPNLSSHGRIELPVPPLRLKSGVGQDSYGMILACFDPQADGDAWEARPNPDHLYFLVDDLDEYFRRVSAQPKGRVLKAIETQPWGERSFYCADPFDNKLCFVQTETAFTGGLI